MPVKKHSPRRDHSWKPYDQVSGRAVRDSRPGYGEQGIRSSTPAHHQHATRMGDNKSARPFPKRGPDATRAGDNGSVRAFGGHSIDNYKLTRTGRARQRAP